MLLQRGDLCFAGASVAGGQQAKQADKQQEQRKWMQAEEVVNSRFNKLENMRYLLRPERKNISFSKSKGRAYAMLAIGLALIVMAFT